MHITSTPHHPRIITAKLLRRLRTSLYPLIWLLFWQPVISTAQDLGASAKKGPKDTTALLIRHIYPFLAKIDQQPALMATLSKNKSLQKVAKAQQKALKKALSKAKLDLALQSLSWTDQQQHQISGALYQLHKKDPQYSKLINELSAGYAYKRDDSDNDSIYIEQMIRSIAAGMSYTINTYLFGKKPQYAKIDAISIDLNDPKIRTELRDSLRHWSRSKESGLFYHLPLKTAIFALRLNGRTEAILYDPLTGGMNRRPFHQVKSIDFSKYKYSAILIPGLGPEKPGVRLTEGGKARCRMAAAEFKKQQAPFLVVSGGHVHPNKTPFCEAVEMKKYMVDSLHMDGATILIEPYARHTTTNLRNVTRLLHLMRIPLDKPVLIATDKSQSKYINNGMRKTSIRDLGYTPYRTLNVITPERTSFMPSLNSLRVNPLDPLDP